MNKEENILSGWGNKVELNQIRMDVKGNLGLIIAITTDALYLQRSDRGFEIIPRNDLKIFTETTFSIGSINDYE